MTNRPPRPSDLNRLEELVAMLGAENKQLAAKGAEMKPKGRVESKRETELREALEGLCYQFAFWRAGDLWHGGLSALEDAFAVLGWGDIHPCPEQRCDEPGCTERSSCGTPTSTGFRWTCYAHKPKEGPPK